MTGLNTAPIIGQQQVDPVEQEAASQVVTPTQLTPTPPPVQGPDPYSSVAMSSDDPIHSINEASNAYNTGGIPVNNEIKDTTKDNLRKFTEFGLPATMLGFTDTVMQSVGLAGEDSVKNWATANLGELGRNYAENADTYRTIGDVAGSFIPGMIAEKAIKAGSIAERLVTSTGLTRLRSIFTSGTEYGELLTAARRADIGLATQVPTGNFADPAIQGLRAQWNTPVMKTAMLDSLKKTVAFEAGVYAVENKSNVLYPDDQSLAFNLTVNSGFAAAGMGVEYLATKKLLSDNLRTAWQATASARDIGSRGGVDGLLDVQKNDLSRPNYRDSTLTSTAIQMNVAKKLAADPTLTDLERRQMGIMSTVSLAPVVQKQMTQMFTDGWQGVFPALKKDAIPDGAYATLTMHLDRDSTAMLNTIASTKTDVEDLGKVNDLRVAASAKIKQTLLDLEDKLGKETDPVKQEAIRAQQRPLYGQWDALDSAQIFIMEPDGNITLNGQRTARFYDQQDGYNVTVKAATTNESKLFTATPKPGTIGKSEGQMAVNSQFLPIIPQTVESQKAFQRQLFGADLNIQYLRDNQQYYPILNRVAQAYHFDQGPEGIAMMNSLPHDVNRAVVDWAGNSGSINGGTGLRKWENEGDPKFNLLYNAPKNIAMRQELGDIFKEGTVPLWRGQSKAETVNPTNNLVSMSSDPAVARGFAGTDGDISLVHVPISSIVMIHGGLNKEYEYMVKDALQFGNNQTVVNTADWAKLTPYRRSVVFALQQNAVEDMVNNVKLGKAVTPIAVPEGAHWVQMDAIQQAYGKIAAMGKDPDQFFEFPQSVMGKDKNDWMTLRSLAGKYADLGPMLDARNTMIASPVKIADKDIPSLQDVIYSLNLPAGFAGANHPVTEALLHTYASQGTDDLMHMFPTMDTFNQYVNKSIDFPEIMPDYQRTLKYTGNGMDVLKTDKGTFAPSVTVAKRPMLEGNFTINAMRTQAEARRGFVMDELSQAGAKGADLVQAVVDAIAGAPGTYNVAQQIDRMGPEGTQLSKGEMTTQQFRTRYDPQMNAINAMNSVSGRGFQSAKGDKFQGWMPVLTALRSPQNVESMDEAARYVQSFRSGWKLSGEILVDPATGKTSYTLDKSAANKARWYSTFGTAMPENAKLPWMAPNLMRDKQYIPLELGQLGAAGAETFKDMSKSVLLNMNPIRKALGYDEITPAIGHVPPKNFAKGEIAFLLNGAGRVTKTISGATAGELERKLAAELSTYDPLNKPLVVDKNTMTKFHMLQDEVFGGFIDYGDPLAQTGSRTGSSATNVLETGDTLLSDIVDSVNKQFETVLNRTRGLMFEPQVNYAMMMQRATALKQGPESSVWQQYLGQVFNQGPFTPASPIGKMYHTIENIYDYEIAHLYDKSLQVAKTVGVMAPEWLTSALGKMPLPQSIKNQLPQFQPFADAAKYGEVKFNMQAPPTMRKMMAAANSAITTVILRFMEVGQSLQNVTGLAATMPAITKAMAPLPGESWEALQARNAWFGSTLKDGTNTVFSSTKMLSSAVSDMFTEDGQAILKRAADKGLLRQEVAEQARVLHQPEQTLFESKIGKFVNAASWLTDKSEEYSRAVAFMAGYKIANHVGIPEEGDRFIAANDFANKVVGDYRPLNRPQIFQGAVGMPLGLFQTYMWNYGQRLFSYIENKQTRALATQYFMQSAVYGAQTVPGFDQFNRMFSGGADPMNATDPQKASLVDRMNNFWGPTVADIILHGTISNIPRIWSNDGIALYTRGNANANTIPTIGSISDAPVAQLAKSAWGAFSDTANMFRTGGQFSWQQMQEILGTYTPNRPIKGLFELASGYSVDAHRQVINDDTRAGMSVAARMMGLRTLNEKKMMEAYANDRGIQMSQMDLRERVRDDTRAMFRSGNFDGDHMAGVIQNYIRSGGNPAAVGQFLRDQVYSGLVNRNLEALMGTIHNPSKFASTMRMVESLSMTSNDPSLRSDNAVQTGGQ